MSWLEQFGEAGDSGFPFPVGENVNGLARASLEPAFLVVPERPSFLQRGLPGGVPSQRFDPPLALGFDKVLPLHPFHQLQPETYRSPRALQVSNLRLLQKPGRLGTDSALQFW